MGINIQRENITQCTSWVGTYTEKMLCNVHRGCEHTQRKYCAMYIAGMSTQRKYYAMYIVGVNILEKILRNVHRGYEHTHRENITQCASWMWTHTEIILRNVHRGCEHTHRKKSYAMYIVGVNTHSLTQRTSWVWAHLLAHVVGVGGVIHTFSRGSVVSLT